MSSSAPSSSPQPRTRTSLDLGILPPVFVLSTHLAVDHLHELEDKLVEYGAPVTYNIAEAKLVIGKVGTKRRAVVELRSRRLYTDEATSSPTPPKKPDAVEPPSKRRKVGHEPSESRIPGETEVVDGSTTEDEADDSADASNRISPATGLETEHGTAPVSARFPIHDRDTVKVIRMDWLEDSSKAGKLLPLENYLVYEGTPTENPPTVASPRPAQQRPSRRAPSIPPASQPKLAEKPSPAQSILDRAKADVPAHIGKKHGLTHYSHASRGQRRFKERASASKSQPADHHQAALLQQTTSEYEGQTGDLPPPPDWVKSRANYACERITLAHPPNQEFLEQLKKIKSARLLIGDEIGVRAYSTSIASIAAYPYRFIHPKEIMRLPGCDTKIANLWIEWKNNDGVIEAVQEAEDDEDLKVLHLFYDIWGVGATTAREFVYEKGWRDLDDIVEFGWSTLTRVQQIGLKYHDEFRAKIPRREAEFIAATVREHAVKVRDEGVEVVMVGGYRRGTGEVGDVDLMVSHRDPSATMNIITDIVSSLEMKNWVTHTLLLSLTGTTRGQSTLPFRAAGGGGHGFDTLDKALVVWQDPDWPTKEKDLATDPEAKNPNIHRRVDIIVSPWRTMGCAVAGWSGGATFQRDLRRYAKNVKGWKFDSSGVRDRYSGEVVELEGPEGVDGTWQEAERAVFEGMGLEYREPRERCTD